MKNIVIILILICNIYAEPTDSTLKKLEMNKTLISQACRMFEINPSVLNAIILTERSLNYDWMDEALDVIVAKAGKNSSIGFCQVKLKTAYWIEIQLNDSTSKFFPGKEYFSKLPLSQSPSEIITKLAIDSLNIFYAAAYLRIIISFWKNAGYPISGKAEIIGTLYSAGLFLPSGKIREPNGNPCSNTFGKKVIHFLDQFHFD